MVSLGRDGNALRGEDSIGESWALYINPRVWQPPGLEDQAQIHHRHHRYRLCPALHP